MSSHFSANDHRHMARALQLAEQGIYTTRPNPRVGCVLVREGKVVGEGAHLRAGEPHAEVLAIRAAGAAASGATAYVTLEPCSHYGRTPPCAEALVEAGVAEVVAAMQDPNPRVAGRGAQRLASVGMVVRSGLMAAQAEALNPGFLSRMTRGRPYVRVKLAMSLDGRTAMASGESKWISSEASRRDVHRLRARSCAVLTGSGTVLADDPALTARDAELPPLWHGQPRRVVLDRRLVTPPQAAVVAGEGGCLLFHAQGTAAAAAALAAAGAQLERVPERAGRLDLEAVLRALAEQEVNEVLVESGPTLAGAFVQAGLADELVIYMASHLMGHAAKPLLELPGIASMGERLALALTDVRQLGPDLRITAKPAESG